MAICHHRIVSSEAHSMVDGISNRVEQSNTETMGHHYGYANYFAERNVGLVGLGWVLMWQLDWYTDGNASHVCGS
jgi:hypothetical protein